MFPTRSFCCTLGVVVDALEALLLGLLAIFAGAALWRAVREDKRFRRLALAVPAVGAIAGVAIRSTTPNPSLDPARPQPIAGEWVSSAACRSCHPAEHASWHRSYHRSMTQAATPDHIVAPMDGRALHLDGRMHRFERRGEEVWATLPDPDIVTDAAMRGQIAESAPDVQRRVVLTTGSHHEQGYWVSGRRPGDLRLFPFIWLIREQRWIPRRDAFLQPPDSIPNPMRWNSNCIACHAVGGKPGHDLERDIFVTRVVDLGIACEACHGPGEEHVRKHRDPITRYVERSNDTHDPTIVNPTQLAPELSASVCGQCHAYAYPKDEDEWWSQGYSLSFRAGQSLERSRTLVTLDKLEEGGHAGVQAVDESLFWADGAIRVGGREYNALVESACYQRGTGERKMTCLSCHSMHSGKPDDQLDPRREGDRACIDCHQGKDNRAHTHHAQGSPGSSCIECHAPQTTYALFKAIRSHRIDAPKISATLRSGRPNACNLCHLDKSLAWTGKFLEQWYGASHVDIEGDYATNSAIVVEALRGDAAVRVISAAALGRDVAISVSGPDFSGPVLAELLVDPYSAVRFVAGRSLHALPDYAAIEYDFLAPPDERARARVRVLEISAAKGSPGGLSRDVVQSLLAKRDTRAVTIAE